MTVFFYSDRRVTRNQMPSFGSKLFILFNLSGIYKEER